MPKCARLRVCQNNASLGEIWAVGPNLDLLDNIILIVDNKNVFTYLGWLGISRVINQKPPNVEDFSS